MTQERKAILWTFFGGYLGFLANGLFASSVSGLDCCWLSFGVLLGVVLGQFAPNPSVSVFWLYLGCFVLGISFIPWWGRDGWFVPWWEADTSSRFYYPLGLLYYYSPPLPILLAVLVPHLTIAVALAGIATFAHKQVCRWGASLRRLDPDTGSEPHP